MKTEITAEFEIREHIRDEQDEISLQVAPDKIEIEHGDYGRMVLSHDELRAIITAFRAYEDAVFAASKATGGNNA